MIYDINEPDIFSIDKVNDINDENNSFLFKDIYENELRSNGFLGEESKSNLNKSQNDKFTDLMFFMLLV